MIEQLRELYTLVLEPIIVRIEAFLFEMKPLRQETCCLEDY